MRVHIATDHAGFELKGELVSYLAGQGLDVVDHGASVYDPLDDYPPVCFEAAQAVAGESGALGIVIGGSGNGEQIAANKVTGIRAALAWNEELARLARQHNDANVVALGARMVTVEQAKTIVAAFLAEPFSGDPRHARRIELIRQYEN